MKTDGYKTRFPGVAGVCHCENTPGYRNCEQG